MTRVLWAWVRVVWQVRHGIMLVGPSGSGKTAIMDCLAAALTELGTKTVLWRMNPKVGARALAGQLEGSPASLSRTWLCVLLVTVTTSRAGGLSAHRACMCLDGHSSKDLLSVQLPGAMPLT